MKLYAISIAAAAVAFAPAFASDDNHADHKKDAQQVNALHEGHDGAHAADDKMHDAHDDGHDHGAKMKKATAEDAAAANEAIAAAVAAGGDRIDAALLGVVCDFCATALNKTFGKRKEVAASYVDLDTKTLTVVTKPGATLEDETISKLVVKAGYRVEAINRGGVAPANAATTDEALAEDDAS